MPMAVTDERLGDLAHALAKEATAALEGELLRRGAAPGSPVDPLTLAQLVAVPIVKTLELFRHEEIVIGARELAVFLCALMSIMFGEMAVLSAALQALAAKLPADAAAVVEELERAPAIPPSTTESA